MIEFDKYILDNGLKVLIHEDRSTPMAAVNVLYDVGSRDESPEKTGFAHLFEHLMFGGSIHIPDFDEPIQNAGGENNAFTNNDMTCFYDVLPAQNLETALWLESDRMLELAFSRQSLDVQKKVVIEEFNETCLNQPYGDAWHHLSEMAYQVHPYHWPTIGKTPQHIADATLEDVKQFFYKFYRPNNAILAIAGNVDKTKVLDAVHKWFGDIPAAEKYVRNLEQEPKQKERRIRRLKGNHPVDNLYLAFRMSDRLHPDFYATDLLSDILCNGESSRLYRNLLMEKELFSSIDCYITSTLDSGLLIIEGKPSEGISLDTARDKIWQEIEHLRQELISDQELEKLKNKTETNLVLSEISPLSKSLSLSIFELIEDASLINDEADRYLRVTPEDIRKVAQEVFLEENCIELVYEVEKN